jgi:hypothetical protein
LDHRLDDWRERLFTWCLWCSGLLLATTVGGGSLLTTWATAVGVLPAGSLRLLLLRVRVLLRPGTDNVTARG